MTDAFSSSNPMSDDVAALQAMLAEREAAIAERDSALAERDSVIASGARHGSRQERFTNMCEELDSLEFWDISIHPGNYPAARGWMYAKPTPEKVLAVLTFPRMEPRPELAAGRYIRLSALCANRAWMRDISARVEEITDRPDGSQKVKIVMYRKGKEPPAVRKA